MVAVVTAADLDPVPRIPVRLGPFDEPLDGFLQPVLADGAVRYVGEPVAVVAAEDPYVAEDAAERVVAEYERLPVVLDATAAVEPDAPALHAARQRGARRCRAATATSRAPSPAPRTSSRSR